MTNMRYEQGLVFVWVEMEIGAPSSFISTLAFPSLPVLIREPRGEGQPRELGRLEGGLLDG